MADHAILCGGAASPSQCLFSAVSTLSSPSNPDLCISILVVVFHFAQWGTWCGVHCAGICGAELAPRYYIDCCLLFEHTVCSYSIVLSPCVCLIPSLPSPPLPSPPLPSPPLPSPPLPSLPPHLTGTTEYSRTAKSKETQDSNFCRDSCSERCVQLPILCVHVCIVVVESAWLNAGVGGSELNMDTLPFTFLWLVTCSSLSLSLSLPLPLSCPHSLSPSLPPFLSLSLSL